MYHSWNFTQWSPPLKAYHGNWFPQNDEEMRKKFLECQGKVWEFYFKSGKINPFLHVMLRNYQFMIQLTAPGENGNSWPGNITFLMKKSLWGNFRNLWLWKQCLFPPPSLNLWALLQYITAASDHNYLFVTCLFHQKCYEKVAAKCSLQYFGWNCF